ncbi:MAG: hypothetical protein Q4G67_12635 [Actinomycetia bacterium]|nr:hypothetical protein [Actinomycetes bacterium]
MELSRIRRRFTELPLEQARARMPAVRELLDDLTSALGQPQVPDLGPGVLADQLAVLVHDAYAAPATVPPDLSQRLTTLRRSL